MRDDLLDGEEITARAWTRTGCGASIGIVFQAFNLFPHMSVLDNVTLAPRGCCGMSTAEAEAAGDRDAGAVRPRRQARRRSPTGCPAGSSNGSPSFGRWRCGPTLLLLDEVTSALDPELVGEVLTVVRQLASQGMTMVIATHEMGFARDIADPRVPSSTRAASSRRGRPSRIFGDPAQPRTRAVPAAHHRSWKALTGAQLRPTLWTPC